MMKIWHRIGWPLSDGGSYGYSSSGYPSSGFHSSENLATAMWSLAEPVGEAVGTAPAIEGYGSWDRIWETVNA